MEPTDNLFGMNASQYRTLVSVEGDAIFYDALREQYSDRPEVLKFINSMATGSDYMEVHGDLMRRRSGRNKDLADTLIAYLNENTFE